MSVRVFAPAKVNLSLQIGRTRADGMHPLQSVVMFADAGDWITASPSEDLTLDVTGPFGPALAGAPDNLILRAARRLAALLGMEPHAALTLDKQLPVASGLGGGSSDAAAAIKALNQLWRAGLSDADLAAAAREIGADVPVCVRARTAWMSGVGDVVAPMRAPPVDAVLVNPLTPLSTGAVFREFDRMGLGRALPPSQPPTWASLDDVACGAAALGNDLAAPARALMPEIVDIEGALASTPGVLYAALSGSGATCFALAVDSGAARQISADLAARHPDWWICTTRLGAP